MRRHQRNNRKAGDCACLVSSCIPCLLCLSCSCFQREVESLGPRQAVLVWPVHSTLAAPTGTSYDKAWVSMRWLGHLVSVLSPSATEGTKALTTAGFNSWNNCGGRGGSSTQVLISDLLGPWKSLFALHSCFEVHIATRQGALHVLLPHGLLCQHPHLACP